MSFEFAIAVTSVVVIILFSIWLYKIFKSPFSFPYFEWTFDISRKRNPHIEDLLDTFLIENGWNRIQFHMKKVEQWMQECRLLIDNSYIKKYREQQYLNTLNQAINNGIFSFNLVRSQTRYRQKNYVKYPYTVKTLVKSYKFDYKKLETRYEKLKKIDFECTLRDYHTKNQRKLMTPELRKEIIFRDNFTCSECGKYMPDEVGLQIDHIIPVSKGGKTIKSNLRVLCSKCNGSKHDKLLI